MVHIEVEAVGNPVFRPKPSASPKHANLRILIGGEGQGPNDKIIGAKIMEGPIRIPPDFQPERRSAHIIAVYFNVGAGSGSIDGDIISNGAVRSAFGPRWH